LHQNSFGPVPISKSNRIRTKKSSDDEVAILLNPMASLMLRGGNEVTGTAVGVGTGVGC